MLALTSLVLVFGVWQHYLTAQLLHQQRFDTPRELLYVRQEDMQLMDAPTWDANTSLARPWTVSIGTKKAIAITGAPFTCFTIDTTDDRGFFDLDFREPKLRFLARELAASSEPPAYIRVGGTGSDFLTYLTNNSAGCVNSGPYPNPGPPRSNPKGQVKKYYQGGEMCLTAERLDALIGLWKESTAPIVFGLNAEHRVVAGGDYDVRNARELVKYCASRGFFFSGFQLGNEVNLELSPEQHAKDFMELAAALDPIYDAYRRPRPFYVGPDTHSLHQGGASSKYEARILAYLEAFQRNVMLLAHNVPEYKNVNFRGIGHHEYTQARVPGALFPVPEEEVNMIGGSWRPWKDPLVTSEEAFSRIEKTSRDVVSTLRPSGAPWRSPGGGPLEIWASEIGPHNAGHPPCVEGGRWANFGDGFWWLYTLATKAKEGYDTVCRQDLIGADYALLDCKTHNPLPDYFLTVLWNRLMGRKVLEVEARAAEGAEAQDRRRLQGNIEQDKLREFLLSTIKAKEQRLKDEAAAAKDQVKDLPATGASKEKESSPETARRDQAAEERPRNSTAPGVAQTIKELRDKASFEAILKGELGPGVADETSPTGESRNPGRVKEAKPKRQEISPRLTETGNPRFFAHCASAQGRGMVLGVINPTDAALPIDLAGGSGNPGELVSLLGPIYDEYIMTSDSLGSSTAKLNGHPLKLLGREATDRFALPKLAGRRRRLLQQPIFSQDQLLGGAQSSGAHLLMPPLSYGFFHFPVARLEACAGESETL